MSKKTQKLYCYVDETGQDAGADFFVVVSVVSSEEQNRIRGALLEIEQTNKAHARKWFNSRSPEKEEFLRTVMKQGIVKGGGLLWQISKALAILSAHARNHRKSD